MAAVLLDPTTADPLYRRSVRVSLGHVLHVPFARLAPPWPDRLDDLRREGFEIVALTPSADAEPLDDLAPRLGDRVAFLLGAEGPGLSADGARRQRPPGPDPHGARRRLDQRGHRRGGGVPRRRPPAGSDQQLIPHCVDGGPVDADALGVALDRAEPLPHVIEEQAHRLWPATG